LSMARSQDPDSAGSQFFIVLKDSHFLDGQYTVFGRVTDGMDNVVDKIASLKTDSSDAPVDVEQAKMTNVTVSYDY
jgi:cyclophilin family peptidyl-prolyl cis-trans isomerase